MRYALKNKIFQTLYFLIRTKRVEKSEFVADFANYDARYYQQAHLANLFGGPGIVLYGNSNIEFQNAYRYMSRYPVVTINCGLAGSTASMLYEYLIRKEGHELRRLFFKKSKPIEVLNAFGNHVIQRKMDTVDEAIKQLRSIMPDSYCFGVPPVHATFLAAQAKLLGVKFSREQIIADVKTLNAKLKAAWGNKFIDVYHLLLDTRTGEAYLGMLEDAIHYSGPVKELYGKKVTEIYKQAKK